VAVRDKKAPVRKASKTRKASKAKKLTLVDAPSSEGAPVVEAPVVEAKAAEVPVGTVIRAGETDLAVLNALNETLVKMKAHAFDQLVTFLQQTDQNLTPIDQKYRTLAQKAAQKAGCPTDNGEEWVFTLEDGVFTRKK
jgi:hypothetical protein